MPIIVGVGRSGTTLLRLMLDAHPALAIPPETGFLEPVTRLSVGGEAAREVFFQTVTGVPHWPDARVPADAWGADRSIGAGTDEAAALAVRYVSGMTDRYALGLGVELLGWRPELLPRGV